jgi:uncharacterized protein
MKTDDLIDRTTYFVKETLQNAEGGHDWWHIYRVLRTSEHIARTENVDLMVVQLGALLHDIADAKFHDGDESVGPRMARTFLESEGADETTISHVENIIKHISFRSGLGSGSWSSPELEVVQDADRLDAMGAIGIARAFNYGGFKNRPFYDPDIAPEVNQSKSAYKNNNAPTINHFYEKLLLLKDLMNTKTGRKMAEHRHRYMEVFLAEFYAEWEGNGEQLHVLEELFGNMPESVNRDTNINE